MRAHALFRLHRVASKSAPRKPERLVCHGCLRATLTLHVPRGWLAQDTRAAQALTRQPPGIAGAQRRGVSWAALRWVPTLREPITTATWRMATLGLQRPPRPHSIATTSWLDSPLRRGVPPAVIAMAAAPIPAHTCRGRGRLHRRRRCAARRKREDGGRAATPA